jgi:hypothetical protein
MRGAQAQQQAVDSLLREDVPAGGASSLQPGAGGVNAAGRGADGYGSSPGLCQMDVSFASTAASCASASYGDLGGGGCRTRVQFNP